MLKKIFAYIFSFAILFSVSACNSDVSLSAKETAKKMGVGINLGNTMESTYSSNKNDWVAVVGNNTPTDYETCWGAVKTTQEIIDGIKSEGFDTIRVPVFWGNMMQDAGTYTINSEYAARVKEIVN